MSKLMLHPFTGLMQKCHYVVARKDGSWIGTKKLYSLKEVKAEMSHQDFMDMKGGDPEIHEYTYKLIEEE
jgi:hypothetical protein